VQVASISKKPSRNKKAKTIKSKYNLDLKEVVAVGGSEAEVCESEVVAVGGSEAEVCESEVDEEVSILQKEPEFIQQNMFESNSIKESDTDKNNSHSASSCPYGFGYLSQREKGVNIPNTCIECPDSLDCMLSEYYKKEENVKEIKKWYQF
jgi:hypothetical protein